MATTRSADPPAQLIRAVATDSVDVAVAWGPLAGYFAKRSRQPLTLTPVTPTAGQRLAAQVAKGRVDEGFAYSMSMGVRHGDSAWRAMLDSRARAPPRRHSPDSRGIRRAARGEHPMKESPCIH